MVWVLLILGSFTPKKNWSHLCFKMLYQSHGELGQQPECDLCWFPYKISVANVQGNYFIGSRWLAGHTMLCFMDQLKLQVFFPLSQQCLADLCGLISLLQPSSVNNATRENSRCAFPRRKLKTYTGELIQVTRTVRDHFSQLMATNYCIQGQDCLRIYSSRITH